MSFINVTKKIQKDQKDFQSKSTKIAYPKITQLLINHSKENDIYLL